MIYTPPRTTSANYELREEARRYLAIGGPDIDGELARQRQAQARKIGDDEALALWSRVRWRWLVAQGAPQVVKAERTGT